MTKMNTSRTIGKLEKVDFLQKYYRDGCVKYLIIENLTFGDEEWEEVRRYIQGVI